VVNLVELGLVEYLSMPAVDPVLVIVALPLEATSIFQVEVSLAHLT